MHLVFLLNLSCWNTLISVWALIECYLHLRWFQLCKGTKRDDPKWMRMFLQHRHFLKMWSTDTMKNMCFVFYENTFKYHMFIFGTSKHVLSLPHLSFFVYTLLNVLIFVTGSMYVSMFLNKVFEKSIQTLFPKNCMVPFTVIVMRFFSQNVHFLEVTLTPIIGEGGHLRGEWVTALLRQASGTDSTIRHRSTWPTLCVWNFDQ